MSFFVNKPGCAMQQIGQSRGLRLAKGDVLVIYLVASRALLELYVIQA